MASNNLQTQAARDTSRINGIQKHYMTQASILVGGVAYTPAQAIQIYQADLAARQAVVQAESVLKAALEKAKAARLTAASFDSAFKRGVEGAYANQPDTLADFGIVFAVRRTPSAATKAAAAEKAKATRAARHIMGKTQRSMIVASTSSTAVATAAPAPAPAGSATPAVKP